MRPNLPATVESLSQSVDVLPALSDAARGYIESARADSTKRAYQQDWADFSTWCETHGLADLPASIPAVVEYLVSQAQAGKAPATMQRRLAAIRFMHDGAGYPSPTTAKIVSVTLSGIKRELQRAPIRKAPVMPEHIGGLLAAVSGHARGDTPTVDTLRAARDAALLLLGFAGAFRRSELVGLRVEDVQDDPAGLVVRVRASKTDQEGRGMVKAIPYGEHADTCPVAAVQAWRALAGIEAGPLFRSITRHGEIRDTALTGAAVALIIKRACEGAGLDPARFSGHSLRAGHATAAARNGAREQKIMAQTGHKRRDTLDVYIRDGELFRDNSASFLGL